MKKSYYVVLVVISIAFIVIGLNFFTRKIEHNPVLERKINQQLAAKRTELNLLKLHPTKWVKAYSFGPYTTEDSMEETLGFSLSTRLNLETRDDVNAIVIINEDQNGEYVLIKRTLGDINVQTPYITRENPLITVE